MRTSRKPFVYTCMATAVISANLSQTALAAERSAGLEEIVVTAQKRAEVANEIGMSITALSGEKIKNMGVDNPSDLTKLVPGFVAFEAPRGTPIYSIRGIGFDDSSLASAPTVASYVDEVPLAFPAMGRFATLDLERAEVLKGPQGILFGQNSTAGAINFIAAKPTEEFSGNIGVSYGRFDRTELDGAISGAVSDTLRLRFAAKTIQQTEGWQSSYTRDDSLGEVDQTAWRFLAEWTPTEKLKATLNLNGWKDQSDTIASQLFEVQPNIQVTPDERLEFYPRAPHESRAADWKPDFREDLERDDNFFQGSIRLEYYLTDEITLTSITAVSDYEHDFTQDTDGTNLESFILTNKGDIEAFDQEIRLSGDMGRTKWILGANYGDYETYDSTFYNYFDGSTSIGFLGIGDALAFTEQPIETYAFFGNVDYEMTDAVTLHAGIRYTQDDRSSAGCTADPDTDGTFRDAYNLILGLTGTPNEVLPGGCTTSTIIDGARIPILVERALDEDNVSWRLGLDYQLNEDMLVYGNVSKGYKSGGFPAVNTADAFQLNNVTQESVLAYEAGFKLTMADNTVQLNGATFYYDYEDKQLRGRILDTSGFFGVLEALVNIPKSEVYGAELDLTVAPIPGLLLTLAGTYVHSEVTDEYFNYDPDGNLINYDGLQFPHTPELNFLASADYEFDLNDDYTMFIGVSAVYQDETPSLFYDEGILASGQPSPVARPGEYWDADAFIKPSYTLVDARVGIASNDEAWKAWIWGKNITDKYYITNATQSLDVNYRQAGMPATYGVEVSYQF